MALTIPSRTPWDDRFRTPSVSDLRGALAPQFLAPFDHARTKLAQVTGAAEAIRWHGVWKWTFDFACSTQLQGDVVAFLVPDPARPRLCISVSDSLMTTMDLRKLPKGVRETLASAPAVDGTRWATWDVATKSGVDEIGAFIVAYRTALGIAPEAPAPTPAKARDGKATKPGSSSGAAQANGAASPSTAHQTGSNGTRRARGA